jgi:hypothetical protein
MIAVHKAATGQSGVGPRERVLHVVSPPLSGPDVHDIQAGLRKLGYTPGALDGIYGVASASAVREFQADHHLEADGVVGPRTRAALATAKPGHKPPKENGSAIGLKALAEALRHLGRHESPAGSNRTPFGRWYGIDGVPWSNIFVSYCFLEGAGYTICAGHHGAGIGAKGCAYVPSTEAWLRSAGLWMGRTTPRAGDIAILGSDRGGHIGIVEKSLGGGRFHCIEGNTAVGDDCDGGQVMRRLRYVSQVEGFGRVVR